MDWLIWTGAAVSVAGIAVLFWCIVLARRSRAPGLTDDQRRDILQKVVMLNVGALAVSALGLMLVVAGITLG